MATRIKDPAKKYVTRARAAAKKFKVDEKLSRTAALAAAPWDANDPPVFERAFREAFADVLEERGAAKKVRPHRSSGSSGASLLMRRTLRQSEVEFADNDAKAKAAGLPWNTWVRQKLAT